MVNIMSWRKAAPAMPATEAVNTINDNLCSRTIIVDNDNGYHQVMYVSKTGSVRKSQVLYTARIDAVNAAERSVNKPIPNTARPA
jgi:hypothetical protein